MCLHQDIPGFCGPDFIASASPPVSHHISLVALDFAATAKLFYLSVCNSNKQELAPRGFVSRGYKPAQSILYPLNHKKLRFLSKTTIIDDRYITDLWIPHLSHHNNFPLCWVMRNKLATGWHQSGWGGRFNRLSNYGKYLGKEISLHFNLCSACLLHLSKLNFQIQLPVLIYEIL